MNRILPILVFGTAIAGASACTPERTVLNAPPGKYQTSTSSTEPNGTSVDKKTTATVGYDANGNKEAVVKNQTTVDPPGLFNKSTSSSTAVVH